MVIARRKRGKNISMGKLPPPVGFQIMPASGSSGTNAPAMRPTFAFLPVNADEINKRIFEAKAKWRAANPTKGEEEFPGLPDLYGTGNVMGAGIVGQAQSTPASAMAMGRCLVQMFSYNNSLTGGEDPKIYCSKNWQKF